MTPAAGLLRRREIGKVTALTNPLSGHGSAIHAAQAAIARLHARGIEVVEIIGDDAEDARHLAAAALERGTDALVATGGDGVISNALQVLAGTDVPLGIIPAGTGNDHAREFGIPTKHPEAAADIVADGWTQTIDLGRVRDAKGVHKWFGTVAATGFDSLVTDRANRMSWPHGRLRYYVAMLAELSQLRPLPFRLVLDGTKEIDADITLAAFGNTRSYGGGLLVCPNAESWKISLPCAATRRNGDGEAYWKRKRPGRTSQAVPCDTAPSGATCMKRALSDVRPFK